MSCAKLGDEVQSKFTAAQGGSGGYRAVEADEVDTVATAFAGQSSSNEKEPRAVPVNGESRQDIRCR